MTSWKDARSWADDDVKIANRIKNVQKPGCKDSSGQKLRVAHGESCHDVASLRQQRR